MILKKELFFQKLSLGSAQWGGFSYGISNCGENITSFNEFFEILDYAKKIGIKLIDTSPGYGNAEKNLGTFNIDNFKIVTKTKIIEATEIDDFILERFENDFKLSLQNLNLKKVYGLLIHRSEDILKKGSILLVEKLKKLKDEGLVEKIGISIYEPLLLEKVFEKFIPDIVQLPINIFDQKSYRDGHLYALKEKNVEIHARSIFLQGLLLMNLDAVNPYFDPWKSKLLEFQQFCVKNNISKLEATLNFISNIEEVDQFIMGFDNLVQLKNALRSIDNKKNIDFSNFIIRDEELTNPQKWII